MFAGKQFLNRRTKPYPYRRMLPVVIHWALALAILSPPMPILVQSGDQQWLLDQINSLRANLGLQPYLWNAQLAAAAQQQSEYMASTGHISHTQSNGSTPSTRAAANGYAGSWVSENIYGGTLAQAADAWNFWINSPIHYAGITHRHDNEIGIGVADGAYGHFYTLVFGFRSDVTAPPAEVAANPPLAESAIGAPAAPPTRRPPTRTFTPSPTVPTLTPTLTWTPTATWTPSPTTSPAPPTPTPIVLPTAAKIALAPTASAASVPSTDGNAAQRGAAAESVDQGFRLRDLLPIFLLGQVILIGAGAYSLFFRKARRG